MNETTGSSRAPRRSRLVFAGSTRDECTRLKSQPDTAAAHALLGEMEATLGEVTWVYWSTRGVDTESGAKALWVGHLFEVIDRHITQALALCEKSVTSHQIHLLQVMGHPCGALARAILEQHRSWLAEWVQLRSIDMTEDQHVQWRGFLACAVALHNKTADLLAQAQHAPAYVLPNGAPSMAQTASTTLANLLLAGQLDKARAVQLVGLLADFVSYCNQIPRVAASLQPVWVKVRQATDNEAAEIPVSELQMLFPGRLLHQVVDATLVHSGTRQVNLFNDADAMGMADDYERLAWRLTHPPVLLACASPPEGSEDASTLGEVYGTARATLVASANLLRALFRRQMLTYVDDDDFEPDDADVRDMDRVDHDVPDLDVDWAELQSGIGAPLTAQQLDQKFVNNPEYCEVCFRASLSRKFCAQHLNTGGRSRADIREAKQLQPVYKKTLLTLQAALRDHKVSVNPLVSGAPVDTWVRATTLEGTIEQTTLLLNDLSDRAVWGLDSETQAGQTAQLTLANAVAAIASAMHLVSVTVPSVWMTSVVAVADLHRLNGEWDALSELIDLPLGQLDKSADHHQLLGHEFRVFQSAYNADVLGRLAAMCRHPKQIALVPEDIRRHFYTQWLNGYRPQYTFGHVLATQAHDKDFLAASRGDSAFSMASLWEHFARLAAWRVAQSQPPKQKQRMRRLTRSKVLALRDQGVSVEAIAEKMRTTPAGVRAAIARWEAKGGSSLANSS